MKVVALAGGVGGAKLVHGLALVVPPEDLVAIVNTGDDFRHLGQYIAPDLDTVMYTLAGIANRETGWGIEGDTFACLETIARLGGPSWFQIGDRDLATHIRRTELFSLGKRLTEVTAELSRSFGVRPRILPMSDAIVSTKVITVANGELDFQDYFVRLGSEPAVKGFRFDGIESALAAPEALDALDDADAVIIGPSNPFVSIEPILALPGVRERLAQKPCVAVTPIVGGQALKGPAAKMLRELGLDVSPASVAARYASAIGGFVLDQVDSAIASRVEALGLEIKIAQTVMRSDEDRARLAKETLAFVAGMKPRSWP